MTPWGKTHARIVLFLVFITGLFAGAVWLQVFLSVVLGLAIAYGLFYLFAVPLFYYIHQWFYDQHHDYPDMRYNFYHDLSKHFMLTLWFPFTKLALTLSEIFYASSFYRHYHDFGSEYEFSYHYKSERVAVRPIHVNQWEKTLRVISLRYYVPRLFRSEKPFQARVKGIYRTEFDVSRPSTMEYLLDLQVLDSLYFSRRFKERNAVNMQFIITLQQMAVLKELLVEASSKNADVYLTFDVNLPFRLRWRRFLKAISNYRRTYYRNTEPLGSAQQAAITFVHYNLSMKETENISFYMFKDNPYYQRLSYKDKIKTLKKAGALQPGPRIHL